MLKTRSIKWLKEFPIKEFCQIGIGQKLWKKNGRALLGTNETGVRAELLLSAFKDAPFPLTGGQASTVAGFKGTEEDANRLLRHLYAQGVLQRSVQNPSSFTLAPPPPLLVLSFNRFGIF